MTLKEFFLSLDPNTLADRYAGEYGQSLRSMPECAGLADHEITARLAVAMLAFLGEVKADNTEPDPKHLLHTIETVEAEETVDDVVLSVSVWYTAVVGMTGDFRLDADGYPNRECDTVILNPQHWPRALGFRLNNQCTDPYGQAASLAASLRFPGMNLPEDTE